MSAPRRLRAIRAALRAGAERHSPECLAATERRPKGGPVELTPGCPWCEQVRAELTEPPA